jgi:hypothetical protein
MLHLDTLAWLVKLSYTNLKPQYFLFPNYQTQLYKIVYIPHPQLDNHIDLSTLARRYLPLSKQLLID